MNQNELLEILNADFTNYFAQRVPITRCTKRRAKLPIWCSKILSNLINIQKSLANKIKKQFSLNGQVKLKDIEAKITTQINPDTEVYYTNMAHAKRLSSNIYKSTAILTLSTKIKRL